MRKPVKILLLAFAGVITLAGMAVTFVVATFDPNDYKLQIVRAVSDKTQRTLVLDGDISLRLFPSVGARLGRASLSERLSASIFASLDSASVSVKLLPLLSRQVMVDEVAIDGLRATVVRGKDGKFNIDDLVAAGSQREPDTAVPVAVDIAHVVLKNAEITYVDQAAGSRLVLSKLDLKTGRLAKGVPSRIALTTFVQSDKPRLGLSAEVKTTLTVDREQQHYALAALDAKLKGEAAGMRDMTATAQGDIDARMATDELSFSKFVVNATDRPDGGELKLKLDVPRLTLAKDEVTGDRIALDAELDQAKSKLAARIVVPSIKGNANAFAAGELNAVIEMRQDGSMTRLKLASPVTGSVSARRIELARLVADVGISNPKLPKNPLELKIAGAAQIDLTKQVASMTFNTRLDESSIGAKLGLTRFSPPFYTFDINVDRLDADRYLPKQDAKKPYEPWDFSALKDLNASGSIRIGALKLANVSATNVRLDVKAANGRVDVTPLSANAHGTNGGPLPNARAGGQLKDRLKRLPGR